jgi:hypothetical protein
LDARCDRETAARVFWKRSNPIEFTQVPASAGDRAQLEFSAQAGWTFRKNLANQSAFGTVFSTNDRGLRMEGPFEKKPKTRVRVACYGDEVGFGAGVGGRPYPERLESELRAAFPGADIDVINLSTPGYSLLRIEGRIRETIGWVRPDFIFVQSFVNDVKVEGVRDSLLTNAPLFERVLRRLADSSSLASGLLERLESRRANHPLDSAGLRRVCTEDYMWCALRIRDLCRSAGVNLHLISPLWFQPPPDGATQEQRCLIEIARALRDTIRLAVWNRMNELAEAYPNEMKMLDY